jgi:hypothetical protein
MRSGSFGATVQPALIMRTVLGIMHGMTHGTAAETIRLAHRAISVNSERMDR